MNFNSDHLGIEWKCWVSIPQRDFGEFQLFRDFVLSRSFEFQSLKGILVNFNRYVLRGYSRSWGRFNPSKGFWWISTVEFEYVSCYEIGFQSLKGILVNFNPAYLYKGDRDWQFQSLKGILVNFNLFPTIKKSAENRVSIPQRDFGEFQLIIRSWRWTRTRFQSLKGILVNFNWSQIVSQALDVVFQSLKGILVNFNIK